MNVCVEEQTTVREDRVRRGEAAPSLRLSQVCFDGQHAGAAVELTADQAVLVGRKPGRGGLSVPDVKMSRAHFRLTWDGRSSAFLIQDQGSRNGSYLNGHRVALAPVRPGDVLRAGDSLFIVHTADADDPTLELAASRSSVPVLVLGESGTGKEYLARRIHERSGRKAFVPVNCAAIPRELIASELFGHVRGAFSGATAARVGLFAAAQGGTLFLDEVGDLPLELQPALLRVLDDARIRPVGSEEETEVDVRVLAATNVDPEQALNLGRLRGDLYARLAGFVFELPPLRARRHRIAEIARAIVGREAPFLSIAPDAVEALLLWDFPFNVRELKLLIRAMRDIAPASEQVSLDDLQRIKPQLVRAWLDRRAATTSTSPPPPERAELVSLLEAYGGNVTAVAKHTRRSRAYVYRWMQRVGITRDDEP